MEGEAKKRCSICQLHQWLSSLPHSSCCQFHQKHPKFDIQDHYDLEEFGMAIKNAAIVIGNDYEIELIKRRLNISKIPKNEQIWIITLGSRGSMINQGNVVLMIPPVIPKNNTDPTGAGDAYRAGFLAGMYRNKPLEVCGKMGSLSAVYTVENYGTQTHNFSVKEFCERFESSYSVELEK